MSIKSGLSDFISGIKVIAKGTRGSTAEGDKKLAYMSKIVMGQIETYGTRAVRTQVIKSIESDFKREAKKGTDAVEKMLQNALATPDYMKLLHRLGLEEPHVRVMAMQANREREKKTVASVTGRSK